VTASQVSSEFHSRIVRILSFFFMPLLAAPLALGGGRIGQSYGLIVGLVLLVVYEQLLQFGDAFVQRGRFEPFFGLWLPFIAFAALSLFFFIRAASSINTAPFGNLGEWLSRQIPWPAAIGQRNPPSTAGGGASGAGGSS
jgi:lipopolysaccharide export system permease protein